MKKNKRPQFTTKGDKDMTISQLERLKKDEREMGHYLAKLKKKGKTKLAHTIQRKQELLASRIEEIEDYCTRAA